MLDRKRPRIRDLELNYSQISTFMRCRHKWWLVYVQGVRRRISRRPPALGTAAHAAIAGILRLHHVNPELCTNDEGWTALENAAANAVAQWEAQVVRDAASNGGELFEEEVEVIRAIASDGLAIGVRAMRAWGLEYWRTVELKGVPLIETKLSVPIKGWKRYHGTVDWVAEHVPSGAIWLIDHKTRSQMQPYEAEEVNLQMASYQYLLLRHRIRTVGTVCHQIRSAPPAQPKLNKDGSMSRSRIATDWQTYRDALVANGLDPDNYREMEEKLDVPFFMPIRAYRSEEEYRNTWKEVVVPAATDLARTRSLYTPRRMDHMTCQGCDVRDLCLEALRGRNVEYMLQSEFVVVDPGRANGEHEEEAQDPTVPGV